MRLPTLIGSLMAFLLVACPAPPEDGMPAVGPNAPGIGADGPNGAAPPAPGTGPTEGAGEGADQGTGPIGPIVIDLTTHAASKTQAELKAGSHVTLSGTVTGDCDGDVVIEAIEESAQGEIDPEQIAHGPLTVISQSGPGAFSMAVTKGGSIRLVSFCDDDKSGVVGDDDDDKIGQSLKLEGLSADRGDISIALDLGPTADGPVGETPPPEGEGGQPPVPDGEPGELGPADPGDGEAPLLEEGEVGAPPPTGPDGDSVERPPSGDPGPVGPADPGDAVVPDPPAAGTDAPAPAGG